MSALNQRQSVQTFVPLGKVAQCQYGLSEPADQNGNRLYVGMGQIQNGNIVADRANRLTVSEDIANRYSLKLGDVLFNRTNSLDLVGKTGIVRRESVVGGVFASYLVRLNVDPDVYDARFLNVWMNTRDSVRRLRRLATPGVAQYNIRPSLLADKFLVPAWPLQRQKFVADIDDIFERQVHTLAAQVAVKRALKQGLVEQLLPGDLRFPGFESHGWQTVPLGDFLTHTPRIVPKPEGAFLSAGVRSHGKGVFLKKEFLPEDIALNELYVLKSGDLVINITFGWEGAIAIVPPEADGALVSHRFPAYVVDESKALVEYIRHVIKTPRFVFDVAVASPGGAGRNRVLNRREFLELRIKLPSIREQRRIADVLSAVDAEIELLAKMLRLVELQRSVLIGQLLSGRIAVP